MMIMNKTWFGLVLLLLIGCSKDSTVTPEAQLAKDVAIIDKYLSDNGITAISDPSGLRYVVTTAGTGVKPTLLNKIKVKYVGKLMSSGAIFDETKGTATATFALSTLIQGWQIGFPLLNKGSKATMYIPSGLCYGTKGAPPTIPTNANLIFDVELIDVTN